MARITVDLGCLCDLKARHLHAQPHSAANWSGCSNSTGWRLWLSRWRLMLPPPRNHSASQEPPSCAASTSGSARSSSAYRGGKRSSGVGGQWSYSAAQPTTPAHSQVPPASPCVPGSRPLPGGAPQAPAPPRPARHGSAHAPQNACPGTPAPAATVGTGVTWTGGWRVGQHTANAAQLIAAAARHPFAPAWAPIPAPPSTSWSCRS